jgi:general secretion pathway protein C
MAVSAITLASSWLKPTVQRLEHWSGLSLRFARSQPTTRWIAAAEVTGSIILAACAARLVWAVVQPPEWPQTMDATHVSVTKTQPAWRGDAFVGNPFHRHGAAVTPAASSQRAPETNLSLQLFGIRAGDASAGGAAIIANANNIQNTYVVGQEIMPGVRLEKVSPGHVLIRRNGVLEKLSLDKEADGVAPPGSTGSLDAAPVTAEDGWRRVSLASDSLLSEIQLGPRQGEGEGGLTLLSAKTSGFLEQLGLAPGDVLLSVNGTAVGGVSSLAMVADSVRDAERVTLEIERNGQRKIHKFAIDR